ncbi:MAG: cytidylate kinase-like family protein [Paludibacteraceae bacterium]|jgi:cytidylate kinase|nr:cytidylate kinase-like family protein [Paludibacteraceae bacterium]
MMDGKVIISIGRQFGSGGRSIGKMIADKLGIGYYDVELLRLAAKEIGFGEEAFAAVDEKPNFGRFFQNIENLMSGSQTDSLMSNANLFQVQSDVIRQIAERESCVIMGRCSDYVLREDDRCVSLFLTADEDDRVRRVMERLEVDEAKAEKIITSTNKRRAEYYNYYTGKKWGDAASYHLCVNVTALGEEGTADFICDFVKRKFRL